MFKASISTVSIQRTVRACAMLAAISLLGACDSIPIFQFPGVYKIDIEQGNIVTQEMVDQLRPGMTKRQVTFVMGTPLVRDPFNQDRWDYVYSYQPGGGERGQERLSVLFENDELVSITGDFRPQTGDSAGAFNAPNTSGDSNS